MKGEPRLSFRKLGHLLKAKGIMGKHRVPLWEIALGLVLYQPGLSFRKTAEVLCSGPLNLDTPLRRGSVQGRGRT